MHNLLLLNYSKAGVNPFMSFDWQAKEFGNFQALASQVTHQIYTPLTNAWTHNHFVIGHTDRTQGISYFGWDSGNNDEHQSGAKVKYVYSNNDCVSWTTEADLFPSMDNPTIRIPTEGGSNGRFIIFVGMVRISGVLYAFGEVNDIRDLSGANNIGVVARSVNGSTLGDIFWVWNASGSSSAPSPKSGYPSYPFDSTIFTSFVEYYLSNPPSAHGAVSNLLKSRLSLNGAVYSNTGELIETSGITLNDGTRFKLWRGFTGASNPSYYYYQRSTNNGATWTVPALTNIPFPNSKGVLKIFRNTLCLFGNPKNDAGTTKTRDPLIIAVSKNGVFTENNVYNIRQNGNAQEYEGGFKGGHSFSYPDAIESMSRKIVCAYSTYGKERIEIDVFNLPVVK